MMETEKEKRGSSEIRRRSASVAVSLSVLGEVEGEGKEGGG